MKTTIQDKNKLVNSVFSRVYKKYDLMNDIISLRSQSLERKIYRLDESSTQY